MGCAGGELCLPSSSSHEVSLSPGQNLWSSCYNFSLGIWDWGGLWEVRKYGLGKVAQGTWGWTRGTTLAEMKVLKCCILVWKPLKPKIINKGLYVNKKTSRASIIMDFIAFHKHWIWLQQTHGVFLAILNKSVSNCPFASPTDYRCPCSCTVGHFEESTCRCYPLLPQLFAAAESSNTLHENSPYPGT